MLIGIASEKRTTASIEMTDCLVHVGLIDTSVFYTRTAVLFTHVALVMLKWTTVYRESAVVNAEARLLQARVVGLVHVWHRSLVLVIDGEEPSLFTKVAISLVDLWCLSVDRVSSVSRWLRNRQVFRLLLISVPGVLRYAHVAVIN